VDLYLWLETSVWTIDHCWILVEVNIFFFSIAFSLPQLLVGHMLALDVIISEN
jgi:hypothetical protein